MIGTVLTLLKDVVSAVMSTTKKIATKIDFEDAP